MKLEKDKVPNVRRKFCAILPNLKQTLSLPEDVLLLAKIKEKLSYLSLDKDRDVKEGAAQAKQVLQSIETETNRGFRLNLQSYDDINDKRKEKEEAEWMDTMVLLTFQQTPHLSHSTHNMRRKSVLSPSPKPMAKSKSPTPNTPTLSSLTPTTLPPKPKTTNNPKVRTTQSTKSNSSPALSGSSSGVTLSRISSQQNTKH